MADTPTPTEAAADESIAAAAGEIADAAATVAIAANLEDDKWTAILSRLDRIEAKQDEAALVTAIAEAEAETPTETAEPLTEAEPLSVAPPAPPTPTRASRKRALHFGSKRR